MIKCMLLKANKSCVYGGEELINTWREHTDSYLWLDIDSHDKEQERLLLQLLVVTL